MTLFDWVSLLIIIVCLMLSFFFAGSETALMALMAQDKKVKRGKLTFILLQSVGRAVIAPDVEPSLVRDFLKTRLTRKT